MQKNYSGRNRRIANDRRRVLRGSRLAFGLILSLAIEPMCARNVCHRQCGAVAISIAQPHPGPAEMSRWTCETGGTPVLRGPQNSRSFLRPGMGTGYLPSASEV